ncbi:MAG TPA: hypothetical protein VK901_06750 [Nitrospiraceae bacterium]|nr:hypothetical protein [Nitrospiraceae bacterium]
MRKDRRLGLDELMIVNPSSLGTEAMFLGEDGTLYQVQGLSEEKALAGLGQCFLGEDGSLYQVQGFDVIGSAELGEGSGADLGADDIRALGRYFLGADGGLYEVVR